MHAGGWVGLTRELNPVGVKLANLLIALQSLHSKKIKKQSTAFKQDSEKKQGQVHERMLRDKQIAREIASRHQQKVKKVYPIFADMHNLFSLAKTSINMVQEVR